MRCCVRMTPRRGVRGRAVIETRRAQRRFGDRLIAAEVADLHGAWMRHADRALNDRQIVAAVDAALARRHPQSRRRGRPGVPAEVVLRVLVLKHIHNWSDQVLEREVRANLVDRDFTRLGGAKTLEAKTMGRWGRGAGAGSDRTDPCEDLPIARENWRDARPARAHRHDGGRNQHPRSDRQQPAR
jgi:Transposase domain (DUF772)